MVSSVTVVGVVAVCVVAFGVGYAWAWFKARRRFEDEVEARKDEALKQSRAVIGGQVAEQMAPSFPEFPGKMSEARFIGKPIDYLVFEGLDEKDVSQVTFVEVKSGKSSLSAQERRVRDAIRDGSVRWVECRVTGRER